MARVLALSLLLVGCGGDEGETVAPCVGNGRAVVTADWLNRSLTRFDEGELASCAEPSRVTIALGEHAPLEVELTGDGRAVVAAGPGFLAGVVVSADRVPVGGALLVVDLAAGAVIHTVALPAAPMGLAITPDGAYALTADYGEADLAGDSLSVIDLAAGLVVASHTVGGRPEQVALGPDGAVGAISFDQGSGLRTFTLEGSEVVLSDALVVADDPGDVAFVSRERLVVTSSLALSYSVIDVSDPLAPAIVAEHAVSGVPFGVTAVPGTSEVVLPTFLVEGKLLHVDVASEPPTVLGETLLESGALTLGAAVSSDGRFAFVPQPAERRLSVVDLAAESARSVVWLEDVGPTWVAAAP
jgi:sugar lactone lactonase YvrE